jgi:hypothetical protein
LIGQIKLDIYRTFNDLMGKQIKSLMFKRIVLLVECLQMTFYLCLANNNENTVTKWTLDLLQVLSVSR